MTSQSERWGDDDDIWEAALEVATKQVEDGADLLAPWRERKSA